MKNLNRIGAGLMIGIPTLGRPIPLQWALAFKGLNPPINFNMVFSIVQGSEVGVARCAIIREAIKQDCKYVFFLGDDTEPPVFALKQLIYKMENTPDAGVVGGVYCSKSEPPAPLVFRGNGEGSYWDWKVGEFFEVSGLGMDCTLIRTEIFKNLSEPWFETIEKDNFLDGINTAEAWTEDLSFCRKLLLETRWKVYCDASVICNHWDVYSGKKYTLPKDSLPLRQLAVDKDKRCLMVGPLVELNDETFHVTRVHPTDETADYRFPYDSFIFEKDQFDWVIVTEPQIPMLGNAWVEWNRVGKGKISVNIHEMAKLDYAANMYGGTVNGSFVEVVKT